MKHKLNCKFTGTGEVKDFIFTKMEETETAYLYAVVSVGQVNHYEVFLKKDTPVCVDFNNRIYSETERKEVYPKAKDFGIWAWTYNDLSSARQKLISL